MGGLPKRQAAPFCGFMWILSELMWAMPWSVNICSIEDSAFLLLSLLGLRKKWRVWSGNGWLHVSKEKVIFPGPWLLMTRWRVPGQGRKAVHEEKKEVFMTCFPDKEGA